MAVVKKQEAIEEGRTILQTLDERFARLHQESCKLLSSISSENLYARPRQLMENAVSRCTTGEHVFLPSCGEQLLRSAAVIEQTFGGITANLWDDPFEWTLPEELATPERVLEYLNEVEATRQNGFAIVKNDAALLKSVALPSGEMQTLCGLLAETLVRAAHYQGQAFATFKLFAASTQSDE